MSLGILHAITWHSQHDFVAFVTMRHEHESLDS